MAEVQHKDAPDGQRHEPKGISTAASGQIYVADGLGSGTWTNPITAIKNKNYMTLNVSIPDISTAGSYYVVNPILGKIYKAYVTLDNAITVADSIVSFEIGGVAVSGGNITAAYSGSAAGSVFSSTPSGNNTVSAGGAIEVITDGGSTTSCRAQVTLLMDVS
jgi:hypothetical protein